MKQFPLTAGLPLTRLFAERGIADFHAACAYVQALPYGRNSSRTDFTLVLSEGKGTCSTKHGLLAELALENEAPEVEIIAGIFLMSGETHPVLAPFFEGKPYDVLPECHCYLRYQGERFDYTAAGNWMERIAPKIVREQRMDPHQAGEWKQMIHEDYLRRWLNRKPEIALTFDEIWADRETCIRLLGT